MSTSSPAIQALVSVTVVPAIIDLSAIEARSDLRSGTIEPSAPSVIPIDEKLEKPQSANVAMVIDRF